MQASKSTVPLGPYPWLTPPTAATTQSHSQSALASATATPGSGGKHYHQQHATERGDCSHNFGVGRDRVNDLVQDIIANRSRVLLIDDSKTQQSQISFRDKQAMLIAAALRNNTSFLSIAIRAIHGLSALGLQPIMNELSRHTRVRLVDLRGTIIPPDCFASLKAMVQGNPNIVVVELDGCGVPEDVVASLNASCKLNLMSHADVILKDVVLMSEAGGGGGSPAAAEILRTVVAECDARDAKRDEIVSTISQQQPPQAGTMNVSDVLERFRKLNGR